MEINKVVLAYSGGLDTSVMIKWLKENYGCEIIAMAGNVGQKEELDGLEERALATGADKYVEADLVDEFVEDYAFEALRVGAKYENNYLLGTALARPLISKALVKTAHEYGADAIIHGCTGKGNDQVRFELAIRAHDAEIPIIAPWRFWEIKSREDQEAYAKAHGIELNREGDSAYSEDRNLWHISHEGLELEDPETEPDWDNMLTLCKRPEEAPDEPEYIDIEFEKGYPVAVNGEKLKAVDLLDRLNEIGGKHGIGINDIIESRLVGMKVRGVYENPGAEILYFAHGLLEDLTIDKDTKHTKINLANTYAEHVYNGKWFSTLRESIAAFADKTQEYVTGKVRLKLYKGSITSAGISSPYTLYNEEFATFGEDGVYDQYDAQGFVNLYALSTKIQTMMKENI